MRRFLTLPLRALVAISAMTAACSAPPTNDDARSTGRAQAADTVDEGDDAAPDPSTDDAAPDPSTDDAAPDPSGDDAAPDPSGDDAAPDPSTDDAAPDPSTDDAAPDPSDGGASIDASDRDVDPDGGAPDPANDAAAPDATIVDAAPADASSTDVGDAGHTPPMSIEARHQVLDALENEMARLGTQSPADVTAGLLAFVQSRSELHDPQITSAGDVVAYFPDGVPLILLRNWGEGADAASVATSAPSLRRAAVAAARTESAAASGAPTATDLPSSKTARIMTAFGSTDDSTPLIRQYLRDRGYTVLSTEPTLANLRQISGDGVFYLFTHGAYEPDAGGAAIFTTTPRNPALEHGDPAFADDVEQRGIAYGTVPPDSKHPDAPGKAFYAVLPAFAKAHWHFAERSLVFLNACTSAQGTAMRDAVTANQASVFLGWSDVASMATALQVAPYLFDRLLGANMFRGANGFEAESPQQRPFDVASVYDDMRARGLAHSIWVDDKKKRIDADLLMTSNGKLGPLAPSIAYAGAVDENAGKITLHGLFGTAPVTVYVGADVEGNGGAPLSCTANRDTATCTIAPDQSGYLVAEVSGIRGNPVHLTSWRVPVHYSDQMVGTDAIEQMDGLLRFRADVHSFREKPHAAPRPAIPVDVVATKSSTCEYAASGSFPDEGGIVNLGGRGAIAMSTTPIKPGSQEGCFSTGHLDFAARAFSMSLTFATLRGLEMTSQGMTFHTTFGGMVFPQLGDTTLADGSSAVRIGMVQTSMDHGDKSFDAPDPRGAAHIRLWWDDASPDQTPGDGTPR